MTDDFTDGRGDPWEYDPGPPRNRSWPRLFAETPNYRAIGLAASGKEEFRWHFGPMFYRGRLQDNAVKVLIIGQEGAQDESLSHRSFTGGTGGRMQHFLNHIGITRSYLFLNTFVYPIFGQYDGPLPLLAQDSRSPIAVHRAKILDYALARNDLRLVVAVGDAAKESVATWVTRHGGTADPDKLHEADSTKLGATVRTLGVIHPGAARNEEAKKKVTKDFRQAVTQIHAWETQSPGWLPVDDDGIRRSAASYTYEAAPIPFRDFPFGTNWRLGRSATSGRRERDQEAILLVGQGGSTRNRDVTFTRQPGSSHPDPAYQPAQGDLAYEPSKADYRDFDRGPDESMARLLQGGSGGRIWPDFNALGLQANPSFGHGPVYRGRLRSPSVLVVADQQAPDDLFTGRALTGNVGQHLQSFLRSVGLTTSYGVLRSLPVDSLEDRIADIRRATNDPAVRAIHREVMRRAKATVIVTLGEHAARIVADEAPAGTPVVNLADFDDDIPSKGWAPGFTAVNNLSFTRDVPAAGSYTGDREPIPRADLPYGTLLWQATTGDRAQQGRLSGTYDPDYFRLHMPVWAARLDATPLSAAAHTSIVAMVNNP